MLNNNNNNKCSLCPIYFIILECRANQYRRPHAAAHRCDIPGAEFRGLQQQEHREHPQRNFRISVHEHSFQSAAGR